MEHARHTVDAGRIAQRDDGPLLDVGEERDLALRAGVHLMLGAAQQNVRLQADGTHLLNGVLGRLGLHLAGSGDVGHQRQVHEERTLGPDFDTQLARGLQEGLGFNVTDGTANLHQGNIHVTGALDNATLDFIRDVRDHLHRPAQVVATAFLPDDFLVDPATGEVVALAHGGADEALVVTQVQIRLGAILGDEDLAMLERAHGAGIHIDVGIELEDGDPEATCLEDGGQ